MQRINVILDDETYEVLRALSFQKRKSMSQLVRDSLNKTLDRKTKKEAKLILMAQDEIKLLQIIHKNEYLTEDEFERELNA